jgi:hypothetical protein
MKIVRTSAPAPKERSIKRFVQPPPAPLPPAHDTPKASNATAAHAVRVASSPGGINPKQQIY